MLSERASPAEIGPTDRAGTELPQQNASAEQINILLASLPHDQFGVLSPHMTVERLEQGVILAEAGEETEHVYFPAPRHAFAANRVE